MIHGEHRIRYERRPLQVGRRSSAVRCSRTTTRRRAGLLGFVVVERSGESPSRERLFTIRTSPS